MIISFDISNTTPMIDERVVTDGDESRLKLRQTSYDAVLGNIVKFPVPMDETSKEAVPVSNDFSSQMADSSNEVSVEENSGLANVSFMAVDERISDAVDSKALKVKPAKIEAMLSSAVARFPGEMVIKAPVSEPVVEAMEPTVEDTSVSQEEADNETNGMGLYGTMTLDGVLSEPEVNETTPVVPSTPSEVESTPVSVAPVSNPEPEKQPEPVVEAPVAAPVPPKEEFIPLDVPRESLVEEFSNLPEFSSILQALDEQRKKTIEAQEEVSERQGELDRLERDADDIFATSESKLREAERLKMEAENRFHSADEMNEQLKRKVEELANEQQKVMENKAKEASHFTDNLNQQIDTLNNGKYKEVTDNNAQADKYMAEADEYNQKATELEQSNANYQQLISAMEMPSDEVGTVPFSQEQEEPSYRRIA